MTPPEFTPHPGNDGPIRALLVEDDPADAGLVRHALRTVRRRPSVHHTETLGAALEALNAESFDVVLLDLSLPDSLGFDTVRRMREAAPALPLVILTGRDDDDFAVQAMEAGAQDYLLKGATGAALHRAMRYAIARMHLEERLRRSESRLNGVLTLARDAILVVDGDGRIVMFNPAAERLFGYTTAEAEGAPLARLIPDSLRTAGRRPLEWCDGADGDAAGPLGHIEATALSKDGRAIPVEIALSHGMDRGEALTTAIVRDVTERRDLEAELRRLAATDPLTGLPNRRAFLEAARAELDRVERYGRPAALMMLDIDRFKAINDGFGHAAGDEALRELASVCRLVLRATDVVGRLGGEEFGVLLPETRFVAAREAAERLRAALAANDIVLADGRRLRMTVSIGVTPCAPTDGVIDATLARADRALFRAKEFGRNRVEAESVKRKEFA